MPLNDIIFLSKILYTAHTLDLRRLHSFDKKIIFKNISKQLFETETPNNWETQFIEKLWARSGDYLNATRDRDMEDSRKTDYDKDVFCAQAHNPQLLVEALQLARTKPASALLGAVVTHTQAMRDIKNKTTAITSVQENPYPHTEEEQKKIQELRETLENAPYTASEAYLKILLDDEYIEIPVNSNENIARDITSKNILAFLIAPKRKVKNSNGTVEFRSRIDKPDEHYVQTLVDCMMEERKNRGKIVLYHATEPEMGFFYDVYTQLRNQLMMAGGRDIRALRVLDTGFLKLDEETHKASMREFMIKFHQVMDSNNDYRDLVLSTNFSLFGSDQQGGSDSYGMFYDVKDTQVGISILPYKNFLQIIQQKTGIPLDYNQYKKIMDRHVLTCRGNAPCRNGRLIQIFIYPEVIMNIGYLSVIRGAPVLKNDIVPNLDNPLKLLRTKPTEFHNFLLNTKGGPLQNADDVELRPNMLKLHDLQMRLFMRPEVMFNPQLIHIKSYWRSGSPQHEKQYFYEIDQLTNKNIATWLKMGATAQVNTLTPETIKLKDFTKKVYKGSTGSEAPSSPPPTLEEQFVELVDSKENDKAAMMLKAYSEELLDRTFVTPFNRFNGGGESLNLQNFLVGYSDRPEIIQVAFEKNVFKGGMNAYKIYSLFGIRDKHNFLNSLSTWNDPARTCQLSLKHYEKYIKEYNFIETLSAINSINNEESIIVLSKPIIDLFEGNSKDKVLKEVSKIHYTQRQEIIEETLSYLKLSYPDLPELKDNTTYDESLNYRMTIQERKAFITYIGRIINIIAKMQYLDSAQRKDIWTHAMDIKDPTLSPSNLWKLMKSRVEYMQAAQKIMWISDKISPKGWIQIPFNVEDVLTHAKKTPEKYDSEFLGSREGQKLTMYIIQKLNDHMIPEDDFTSLSSAYDRNDPESDFNKNLIADYVSQLKTK